MGILLLTSLPSFAYTAKEGNVSAALGPYFFQTNYHGGSDRPSSPYLADVGLLVQGDVNEVGSLEISLFHMNKAFFRDQGEAFLAEQVELMQVGLGYRWWMGHYLSFALAFYSSYAMTEPTVIHNSVTAGNELDTSARDTTEYGFDFSLQHEVWSDGLFSAIVDARYAKSLTNKENESGDHYGLFVALRYFIQSKQKAESRSD